MIADAELSDLVREQVEEVLRQRGGTAFTAEHRDTLDKLDGQMQGVLGDSSFGRILTGPLWMSGASVVSGTITADKLVVNELEAVSTNTGSLNVTGTITAAAAFPATGARVTINSAGIWGYSGAATTTFKLNTDGSGEIGSVVGSKITWTNGGVLTIPSAIIGSLSISQITSGNLGGTYSSNTSNPKFQMSPTEFVAFNVSGGRTFEILSNTGAVTMTGSFTVQSATSGARVVITNAGGIEGFNASSTSTFRFNAATGAGYVGGATNGISWDLNGNVNIGGTNLSGGKIQAGSLTVSSLSTLSANMGNLTAGSITGGTVTASVITTGSLVFASGGTFNSGATVSGTFGGLNLANLTITGQLLLSGASAKIADSDGSTWEQSGITLKSSGSYGDAIRWMTGSSERGSIYSTSTSLTIMGANGGQSFSVVDGSNNFQFAGPFGTQWLNIANQTFSANGRYYPGTGGSFQSSYYIDSNSGLGVGVYGNLTIQAPFSLNLAGPGTGGSASSWSTGGQYFWRASDAAGSNQQWVSAGYFNILLGGNSYRVPFFAAS